MKIKILLLKFNNDQNVHTEKKLKTSNVCLIVDISLTSPLLYTCVNIKESFNRMPRVTVGAARLRTLMAQ